MPEKYLGRIIRRTAAALLVSSMGYLIPPDNTTRAQAPEASLNAPLGFPLPTSTRSIAPMNVGFPTREEIPVTATEVGVSTDAEINLMPYSNKEQLPDGLVRYTFPGVGRENIIIAEADGVAQFKRRSLGLLDDPSARSSSFDVYWGPVEGREPAPDEYQTPGASVAIHFFASKGTATVVDESSGRIKEIWEFIPTTLADSQAKWGKGDYSG